MTRAAFSVLVSYSLGQSPAASSTVIMLPEQVGRRRIGKGLRIVMFQMIALWLI